MNLINKKFIHFNKVVGSPLLLPNVGSFSNLIDYLEENNTLLFSFFTFSLELNYQIENYFHLKVVLCPVLKVGSFCILLFFNNLLLMILERIR